MAVRVARKTMHDKAEKEGDHSTSHLHRNEQASSSSTSTRQYPTWQFSPGLPHSLIKSAPRPLPLDLLAWLSVAVRTQDYNQA